MLEHGKAGTDRRVMTGHRMARIGLDGQAWRTRVGPGGDQRWSGGTWTGRRGIAVHGSAEMGLTGQSLDWREAFRHGPNRHGSDG